MAEAILDATGLKCPLPVLKAKRAVRGLLPGDVLEVRATDPGAVADFKHFCSVTGHEFLADSEAGGVFSIRLKIAAVT